MVVGLMVLSATCCVATVHWVVPTVSAASVFRVGKGLGLGLVPGLFSAMLPLPDGMDAVTVALAGAALGSIGAELVAQLSEFRRTLRGMRVSKTTLFGLAVTVVHALAGFSNSFIVYDHASTAYLLTSGVVVSALQLQGLYYGNGDDHPAEKHGAMAGDTASLVHAPR